MGVKANIAVGVASGILGSLLTPLILPAIKKGARPMAKGVIKGGLAVYEKSRELTAHAGEVIEDVMAEIHAEQEGMDAAEDETPARADSQTESKENAYLRSVPVEGDNPGLPH